MAIEQPHTKLILKLPDVAAHRWLLNPERASRTPELKVLGRA